MSACVCEREIFLQLCNRAASSSCLFFFFLFKSEKISATKELKEKKPSEHIIAVMDEPSELNVK